MEIGKVIYMKENFHCIVLELNQHGSILLGKFRHFYCRSDPSHAKSSHHENGETQCYYLTSILGNPASLESKINEPSRHN